MAVAGPPHVPAQRSWPRKAVRRSLHSRAPPYLWLGSDRSCPCPALARGVVRELERLSVQRAHVCTPPCRRSLRARLYLPPALLVRPLLTSPRRHTTTAPHFQSGDDVDLNAPEYAEFKVAIEACIEYFKALPTTTADVHLTMVSKKKVVGDKIQLKLVLCTGDACNMKKFTVSGTDVAEGWI